MSSPSTLALFSAKPYDRQYFDAVCAAHNLPLTLTYFEPHLDASTVALAKGFDAVCAFVNDHCDAAVLAALAENNIRTLALRCAGFNNVDLTVAKQYGIQVVRVPAYSPHAVAEHAVALMMSLNRHTHRAYNRVREGNFNLNGLVGFDFYGKTVGVIGTGKIGVVLGTIMRGFGCRVLASDPYENPEAVAAGMTSVDLPTLFAESDIISLHCPLTPQTRHLINAETLAQMKPGVMIINTSRGATVDTQAVIEALKLGQVGALGLDVYEEEEALFFEDLSSQVIQDDTFSRLLTFPNVMITGHQAFLTREALTNIATTTLTNVVQCLQGQPCANQVPYPV